MPGSGGGPSDGATHACIDPRAGAARPRCRAPGPARRRRPRASTGRSSATRRARSRPGSPVARVRCGRRHEALSLARSLGQFGCIRSHCSGAARISSSKRDASRLRHALDIVAEPAGTTRVEGRAGSVRGARREEEDTSGRQERGTGAQRERGRTAGHRRGLAEEVDVDAVAAEVAVADQADHAVRPQRPQHGAPGVVGPSATTSIPRRRARARRTTRTARAARRARPRRGGSYPDVASHAPGEVPVPEVRQGEDRAPARRGARLDVLEALTVEVRLDRSRDACHAAGTARTSSARSCRTCVLTARSSSAPCNRPSLARQVARDLARLRPASA